MGSPEKAPGALEQYRFGLTRGQFLNRDPAPMLLGRWKIGKTEAENIIYWTAICAWLPGLPVVAVIMAAVR